MNTKTVAYELNELKNPICNIYLASDMLKLTELDEEQRKYLEIIMQSATRITDMLNGIVNYPATGGAVRLLQ